MTTNQKRKEEWVFIVAEGAVKSHPDAHMHCTRCMDRQTIPFPMNVTVFTAMAKAYGKVHKKCIKRKSI